MDSNIWIKATDELPSWNFEVDGEFYELVNELVIVRLVRTDEEYGLPLEDEDPIYLTAKMKMGWSGDELYFHFREGSGVEFECLLEYFPKFDDDLFPSIMRGEYSGRYYQDLPYMIHSWVPVKLFEKAMNFTKIETKIIRPPSK